MIDHSPEETRIILAALRTHGDMLDECLMDPAMKSEANRDSLLGFQMESDITEMLIKQYESSLVEHKILSAVHEWSEDEFLVAFGFIRSDDSHIPVTQED